MAENQPTIRELLVKAGYNDGKPLTDNELAKLLAQEIMTLPEEKQDLCFGAWFTTRPSDN